MRAIWSTTTPPRTSSAISRLEFNNRPHGALISHFDGITGTAHGYKLTGDFVRGTTEGAFFAHVERESDGSFGEAHWSKIAFPGADVTSGNTVIDDTVLGVFAAGGETWV